MGRLWGRERFLACMRVLVGEGWAWTVRTHLLSGHLPGAAQDGSELLPILRSRATPGVMQVAESVGVRKSECIECRMCSSDIPPGNSQSVRAV
jgi:NAD-dependent dihydropyrimidine dehydrogenase PreA subunit